MNRRALSLLAVWIGGSFLTALSSSKAAPAQAPVAAIPSASASPVIAGPGTIARIWRGRTLASRANRYEAYLMSSGINRIRNTAGNLGATVLRRTENGQTEFLVISFWESIEAVKNFAGQDYEKAVILPRDRQYLVEVEPKVLHYEVVREERKR